MTADELQQFEDGHAPQEGGKGRGKDGLFDGATCFDAVCEHITGAPSYYAIWNFVNVAWASLSRLLAEDDGAMLRRLLAGERDSTGRPLLAHMVTFVGSMVSELATTQRKDDRSARVSELEIDSPITRLTGKWRRLPFLHKGEPCFLKIEGPGGEGTAPLYLLRDGDGWAVCSRLADDGRVEDIAARSRGQSYTSAWTDCTGRFELDMGTTVNQVAPDLVQIQRSPKTELNGMYTEGGPGPNGTKWVCFVVVVMGGGSFHAWGK